MGKVRFILVRDGTGLIQATATGDSNLDQATSRGVLYPNQQTLLAACLPTQAGAPAPASGSTHGGAAPLSTSALIWARSRRWIDRSNRRALVANGPGRVANTNASK